MRTRRVRFVSGTNRWAHDLYLRAFPEDLIGQPETGRVPERVAHRL